MITITKNDQIREDVLNHNFDKLNTDIDNIKQTLDSLSNNLLSSASIEILNIIYPIGCTYIQFPNCKDPNELFENTTWTNISSDFAGDFFRCEGGAANEFNTGRQAEGLPNITGGIDAVRRGPTGRDSRSGAFSYGSAYSTTIRAGEAGDSWGSNLVFNASKSNAVYGASEHVTPVNSTIRIWKRTA